MKSDHEMAGNVLSRIHQYEVEKVKKSRNKKRTAALASTFCLVFLLGVGLWKMGGVVPGKGSKPVFPHQDKIVWSGSLSPEVDDFCYSVEWNGIQCSPSLVEALSKYSGDGAVLAVTVTRPGEVIPGEFIFDGESYAMLVKNHEELFLLNNKYGGLRKQGHELKYGDALLTTGNAEGVRWAKELYEETVSFYGKEFLDRYIVDGEFLSGQLTDDAEKVNEELFEAEAKLFRAIDSFNELSAEREAKIFLAYGIPFEIIDNRLCIFVTAAELAGLSLKDIPQYLFSHAVKEGAGFDLDRDQWPGAAMRLEPFCSHAHKDWQGRGV